MRFFRKINVNQIIDYLLIFLLIIISVTWVANLAIDSIQYFLYALIILILLIKDQYLTYFKSKLIILTFSIGIFQVVISTLKGGDLIYYNLMTTFKILVGVSVCWYFRDQKVYALRILYNILKFLIYSSLFLLLIHDILSFPLPTFNIPSFLLDPNKDLIFNSGKEISCTLGLHCKHQSILTFAERGLSSYSSGPLLRNRGIFWEPGLYALFSVVSLALAIYFKDKFLHKIIFVISCFSSGAPGGIAILFLFITFSSISLAKITFTKSLIVLSVLLFFSVVLGTYILEPLLYLFGRSLDSDASIFIRQIDLTLPFTLTWYEQPLLGFSTIEAYRDTSVFLFNNESNGITNSIGALVFYNGFIFSFLYFGLYVYLVNKNQVRDTILIPFTLTLIVSTVYEPVLFSPIVVFLLTIIPLKISPDSFK